MKTQIRYRDYVATVYGRPGRQSGAVLIVSLMILLIMTLLGVTAMSSTSLEERMAGNMRDRNVAFQASEASLEAGEAWIQAAASDPGKGETACASPPCDVWATNALPNVADQSAQWWTANGREYGTSAQEIADAAADPRYVVEVLPMIADDLSVPGTGISVYRITARGTGATPDAQVVLQTLYMKRFN